MRRSLLLAAPLALTACASGQPIHPALESDMALFSNAPTIEVRLANFDFTPPLIRMRAGHPYRLELHNDSGGGHTFTAPAFFAAARVAGRDAPLIAGGQVRLAGGESRIVHLIPARGTYKLVCSHRGHALLGMTARIAVD